MHKQVAGRNACFRAALLVAVLHGLAVGLGGFGSYCIQLLSPSTTMDAASRDCGSQCYCGFAPRPYEYYAGIVMVSVACLLFCVAMTVDYMVRPERQMKKLGFSYLLVVLPSILIVILVIWWPFGDESPASDALLQLN